MGPGGNPVLALLLGLALGTSSCNWRMLCPVLMIMLGAIATIHGELSLSYLGLALLVSAILIEQSLGAKVVSQLPPKITRSSLKDE